MKISVLILCLLATLLLVTCTEAKTSAEWRQRTMYQILVDRFSPSVDTKAPCADISKYCGGTWRGIQNHLDYVIDMGFDAIWISPIVKNTPEGYHGFWLEDLSQVNPHFGTEQDLKSLIDAAHRRGLFVMVGVVANHVGPVEYNYSSIVQFNSQRYYHDCNGCPSSCNIEDWMNQPQVENCRLSGLPDLNQSDPYVSSTLISWVRTVVQKYNVDGVRIDTVPEVPKPFWTQFVSAAGVFQVGEVFDGRVSYLASYQPPLTSLLSYPLYFTIKDVFAYKHSMYGLRNMLQSYESTFSDASVLGTFLDNHDNARFLSLQPDLALYKAALTFVLYTNGIPIVYYGTEQGFNGGDDPKNREPLWTTGFNTASAPLYAFLKQTIALRKKMQIWNLQQIERYADDQFYAFSRGSVFVALTNVGSNSNSPSIRRQITYHPYAVGTTLCNLFWPSDCVGVTSDGFTVVLNNGETKIFTPSSF